MIKGIDISYAQDKVDYSKVKSEGIEFAIIRLGYGKYINQKDAMFDRHYEGAKNVGLHTGGYWYSYSESIDDAKREAETCLEILKGKQFEYPICFDMEEKRQIVLGKETISEMAKIFCDTLEKEGYYVMLYSYAYFLKNYILEDIRKRYDVWVAHTEVDKPNYPMNYGIWQFSHTGKVNGIEGNVDLDYSKYNYEKIMKRHGLNGFSKSFEEKTDDALDYYNYKVKKGDSFWRIAQNELGRGARYMDIVKLNNMKADDIIYPNQILKVPKK